MTEPISYYKLAPSILAADFTTLGRDVATADASGAHYIHFDVMDGYFVRNLSFGVPVMEGIRPLTALPFDVHLLVKKPLKMVDMFALAGADILTVHWETKETETCLDRIRALGKKASVAIRPETPVESVLPLAERADMVLIMSVEPGFGGQPLQAETLRKAEWLANWLRRRGLETDIEMDGGICLSNADSVLDAGVNVIVAGTAVFAKDPNETAANVRAFLEIFKRRGGRAD